MKKKQSRMRVWITPLALILVSLLAAACDSPASAETAEPAPVIKPSYDVNYDGNGNSAGEAPVDANKYVYETDSATLLEKGSLYRVGYRFTGWNTAADGTGIHCNENEPFSITDGPVTFYAEWKEVFPRISAGDGFSALVTEDGILYTAGRNANGRLGLGEGAAASGDRHKFSPVATTNIPSAVQSVCSGTDHSIALLIDGSIVGWGQGDQGKLGFNVEYGVFATPNTPNFVGTSGKTSLGIVKSISAGRNQTAILNKDGEYWAMGNKINGALGIETGTPNRETQLRYITNNVNSVATGLNYILLIKTDGSMWISGEGAYGKLGTSSTSNVPKLKENTAIDHNNLAVFAGKNNHSMVLKKDHRVMAAGANSHGQLGNGNTKQQEFWTVVIDDEKNELTGAATISLGENHSMILKNDGTLWAMGRNSELQLGTASTLNHLTAVKVLDDVAYVAAGYYHTLAVKQDGSLWAAGSNQYGQFGQTASSKNSVWTQIDISAITPPPVSTQPANP